MTKEKKNSNQEPLSCLRIDKWLWAARFFKTRSIAQDAVSGGKVKLGGKSLKPSSAIKTGDLLEIRQGYNILEIEILELSDKRAAAPIAQKLYQETEKSIFRRKTEAESRASEPKSDQRPDKKQRRKIIAFKQS